MPSLQSQNKHVRVKSKKRTGRKGRQVMIKEAKKASTGEAKEAGTGEITWP